MSAWPLVVQIPIHVTAAKALPPRQLHLTIHIGDTATRLACAYAYRSYVAETDGDLPGALDLLVPAALTDSIRVARVLASPSIPSGSSTSP